MDATSKHLRSTTELTLVAKIKPGFVEIDQPLTYSSRLKILLRGLFDSRQRSVERDTFSSYVGPLERLGSLHFVRWNVFDSDQKLLLAISFDRPWEPYIRLIVAHAGPILDLIFSHCDDFEGSACWDGYPKFSEWVRERQIDCNFLYAGAPDTSVDDVRYLKEVEKLTRSGLSEQDLKTRLAEFRVGARITTKSLS